MTGGVAQSFHRFTHSFVFWFPENKALDGAASRNILRPSRTDKGRVAIVFETRSGLWMAATMPDPRGPSGVPGRPADRDRRRRNGRTAQVHVRATARTNGVASAQVTPLGHGASREIQSRAERRRRSASEAWFFSATFGVELNHRPCANETACGIPVCQRMRAPRARHLRPVVPHAPLGGSDKRDRRTPSRTRRGAMSRVCSLMVSTRAV